MCLCVLPARAALGVGIREAREPPLLGRRTRIDSVPDRLPLIQVEDDVAAVATPALVSERQAINQRQHIHAGANERPGDGLGLPRWRTKRGHTFKSINTLLTYLPTCV